MQIICIEMGKMQIRFLDIIQVHYFYGNHILCIIYLSIYFVFIYNFFPSFVEWTKIKPLSLDMLCFWFFLLWSCKELLNIRMFLLYYSPFSRRLCLFFMNSGSCSAWIFDGCSLCFGWQGLNPGKAIAEIKKMMATYKEKKAAAVWNPCSRFLQLDW